MKEEKKNTKLNKKNKKPNPKQETTLNVKMLQTNTLH